MILLKKVCKIANIVLTVFIPSINEWIILSHTNTAYRFQIAGYRDEQEYLSVNVGDTSGHVSCFSTKNTFPTLNSFDVPM